MVLTFDLIRKKLSGFLYLLVFIFALYVISNFLYLIWYIANPEGFWGLNYFWELIVAGIIALILLVLCIFLILGIITSLYKIIIGKGNLRELFKLSGILIAVILLTGFNYLYGSGFSFYISKKLSDKYSCLQKTEKYLNEGDKITAFEYAKSSYEKETNRKEISKAFFLAKLYSETDFDRRQKLIDKYSALIGYAYCLKSESLFISKSESLFNTALKLINSDLVKHERSNLSIFPTLSLAEINLQKGNYATAENYFSKLYELNKNCDQKDVYYIISSNILFADQALRIGDINKAMKLQLENLTLYERTDLSKTSSDYLSILLLATTSELYFQNFEKASDLLLKAIPIAEKKQKKAIYSQYLLTKANYCYSSAINNRGNEAILDKTWWEKVKSLFSEKSNINNELQKEAKNCYTEFVEITKEKSGNNSFEYINSLNQLAFFYGSIGNFDLAKKNCEEALSILKTHKETNKDLYYSLLLNSISIGFNKNESQSNLEEIEKYYYQKLADNYLFLTEEEKVSFSLNTEIKFDIINSIYVNERTQKSGAGLYNNTLVLKNIALYSNQNIRDYLNTANPILKKKYQELLDEKEKLAYSKEKELNISNKQRSLIKQITSNSNYSVIDPKATTWDDIKNALDENEIAIEIINVPKYKNGKSDRSYYALIVNHNSNTPEIIPLFMESELSNILNKKGNTEERINSIYLQNKKKLETLIFGKIENKISLNDKIYLSVSGLLHTISFPGILNDKKLDITYVGSTKEIIKKKIANSKKNSIALFGDVDYGKNVFEAKSQNINRKANINFNYLKHSKIEISRIKDLFQKTNNKVIIYSQNKATEQNFRNLSGKEYDIVHIATHGFYDKFRKSTFQIKDNENVLFKSGLVLANANLNLTNMQNNGILTSFEISQMNLSNIDLVVMSACETGLGDIKGSEGIFGLQRAFKLAGVKSMIVSLWQVPDEATSELMVLFYNYYLKGGTKKESLLKAQEEIKNKYKSPFNWAGFILIE